MRHFVVYGALALCAYADKPAVDPALLKAEIVRQNLWDGSERLQSFADASTEKNRMVSSSAHEATVHYLKESLMSLNYYDVSIQPFWTVIQFNASVSAFKINGTAIPETSYSLFEYSPSGKVTASLMLVEGGCNKTDYPTTLAGKIALIPRGTCDFGLKSAFAGSVGAAGAILYNINDSGPVLGTLLAPPRPEGPYVPTLNVIQNVSTPIISALKRGEDVLANFDIVTDIRNITTPNLFATTKTGDTNNKLIVGAHTDSVGAGPGINDNGSGINALLEVAKALSKFRINNAVTFAFWTAEEEGLRGSKHFIESLSPAEATKIRAYLNFDMIASPNYVNFIYDGVGQVWPAGSAELKAFFQGYFQELGKNYTVIDPNGRTDTQPFLDAGIPVGGTFTGAEQSKTEKDVILFGGQVGVPYDHCYHKACDTLSNLNMDAFELHAKAIAAAVATYATSWDGFPARNTTSPAKRSQANFGEGVQHFHDGGLGCSHSFLRI